MNQLLAAVRPAPVIVELPAARNEAPVTLTSMHRKRPAVQRPLTTWD